MIYSGLNEAWTDLSPHSLYKDPNILIPAAEVALYKKDMDDWDIYRRPRPVIYLHTDGTKYLLELTFYIHPTGASDLALYTTATSTSVSEGLFIGEDGVLCDASDTYLTAAGISLGKYFYVGVDGFTTSSDEAFTVASITAGDGIWLIRSGQTFLNSSSGGGTPAANQAVTFDAAGETKNSSAMSGPTAAEIDENSGGLQFIGHYTASATAGNVCAATVRLPQRYLTA